MNAIVKVAVALSVWMVSHPAAHAQGAGPGHLGGRLSIAGSTTMAPLVTEIAGRFSNLHRGVKVEVVASGSGKGIAGVRDGTSDIGMVSRALDEGEKKLFGFPIARDGAGLAVHARNPVKNLTRKQVVGIFTGRLVSWKALGGPDRTIRIISGGSAGGSTEPFLQAFDLKFTDLKTHLEIPANQKRIEAVLADVAAISILSVGEVERLAEAGVPIRLMAIDGVEASRRSILSGDYVMSRPLLLVTSSLPRGLAKAFIDYASSSHVVDLVEKYDFLAYRE